MSCNPTAESVLIEMRDRVVETARLEGGASVKDRLARTARALGLAFSRVQDYWYNEVRAVRGEEVDAIRNGHELARLRRLRRLRDEYEDARRVFLATASPTLARLAPPALPDLAGEPQEATPDEVARRGFGGGGA